MTAELESIRRRAKLLPWKFTKREPQLYAAVLAKPSSRPLPKTDGLMVVEQLIHFGEHCQWVTQKSEHLWFYQRGLDEHFFLTLLEVEPLFDLPELFRIFRNDDRNEGAGLCSSSLMDKVVSMVREIEDKVAYGGGENKTMMFDPTEILQKRKQPKFCASVEVTLRPFHGRDPYLHMAQHFREVPIPPSALKTDLDRFSYVLCIVLAKVS